MGQQLEETLRHPAARLTAHEPVGGQAARRIRRRHLEVLVVKLSPSRLRQIGVAKTEPGDENNQDISALVGKVDIRQLEHFARTTRTPTATPAA
jgi:serine protein kinase